ncbi:MAG: NAD(P)H-binding protein, partial [Nitrososphaera sp.]|nr:NAD(P)H-binding protein [Nitrososphaera sp.]
RPTAAKIEGALMSIDVPILVTGAGGRVGGVGGAVVEMLRQRDLPVRALVRRDDERASALRAIGAEVVVGDLTRAGDVARALAGCRRLYYKNWSRVFQPRCFRDPRLFLLTSKHQLPGRN